MLIIALEVVLLCFRTWLSRFLIHHSWQPKIEIIQIFGSSRLVILNKCKYLSWYRALAVSGNSSSEKIPSASSSVSSTNGSSPVTSSSSCSDACSSSSEPLVVSSSKNKFRINTHSRNNFYWGSENIFLKTKQASLSVKFLRQGIEKGLRAV